MYSCLLYGLFDYVWLLIGWFSNPRDEIEIVAGIATVVASDGSLPNSINQSINQSKLSWQYDPPPPSILLDSIHIHLCR